MKKINELLALFPNGGVFPNWGIERRYWLADFAKKYADGSEDLGEEDEYHDHWALLHTHLNLKEEVYLDALDCGILIGKDADGNVWASWVIEGSKNHFIEEACELRPNGEVRYYFWNDGAGVVQKEIEIGM